MSTRYELSEPLHVDFAPPLAGGRIEADYEPGDHLPGTPGECELFEHLVTIGAASVAAPDEKE
jgi:hypothetical protein